VGPGFFGKLRSHGDFVTRRLPPAFVQPFDAWLQAGLVHSRADLGDRWLPLYLNSPLWRFVLAPGVCGPQAWAGVMMPSVDRVGRCFPLTLAAGMDAVPSLRDCLTRHAAWFAQLEHMALSSLDDGCAAEDFDAALQALETMGAAQAAATCRWAVPSPCMAPSEDVALPCIGTGNECASMWWTRGADQAAPCMVVRTGLPSSAEFLSLLEGRWQ
jgi:type VI secretion system protein ImpM